MKKLIFILLCFCLMTFGSSARIIEVAPAGAWGVLGISGGSEPPAGAVISDDFSGDLSNWTQGVGTSVSIIGEELAFRDSASSGCIIHNTSLGTGNKWIRYRVPDQVNNGLLAIGSDASGNTLAIVIHTNSGYTLYHMVSFDEYDSDQGYESLTEQATGVGYNSAYMIGVTIDKSGKTVRMWANVTAEEPDSLTSWDSSAADATQTFSTSTIPGDRVGFGSWTSGPGSMSFDDFSAGDL